MAKRIAKEPLIGPGARNFGVTKIDIAEARIRTAVTLFFSGQGHPLSIYTLANAAREIVGAIARKTNIRTVVEDLVEREGSSFQGRMGHGIKPANWLKHPTTDVMRNAANGRRWATTGPRQWRLDRTACSIHNRPVSALWRRL